MASWWSAFCIQAASHGAGYRYETEDDTTRPRTRDEISTGAVTPLTGGLPRTRAAGTEPVLPWISVRPHHPHVARSSALSPVGRSTFRYLSCASSEPNAASSQSYQSGPRCRCRNPALLLHSLSIELADSIGSCNKRAIHRSLYVQIQFNFSFLPHAVSHVGGERQAPLRDYASMFNIILRTACAWCVLVVGQTKSQQPGCEVRVATCKYWNANSMLWCRSVPTYMA